MPVTEGQKVFAIGAVVVHQVVNGTAVVQADEDLLRGLLRARKGQLNHQKIQPLAALAVAAPLQRTNRRGVGNPQRAQPQIGLQLGLTDPVCGLNMGQTAEVLAKEFGITRREQDEFALISHERAIKAREILREEIVPFIPGPQYKTVVVDDIGPRENQMMEALAKLKPYFDRRSGTVTAGNSSQITDGAVALLLMSEVRARELGYVPLGYLKAYAFAGVEPHRMGIGPAHAIPQVLRKAGMAMSDIDAFEINEAFAAQVLACLLSLSSNAFAKEFGYEGHTGDIPFSKLNVHGGAIALGHPVGATGSRLILTMLKHLKRNNLNAGLISLCVGGGQGAAAILER